MSEFLHMGGYAFYVWTSYGLARVLLVANVVVPIWRRKQFFREMSRKQRRADRQRQRRDGEARSEG